MAEDIGYITEDGEVVPDPTVVTVDRDMSYGSVPGLTEEELADPVELERQVMLQEWGPILALPPAEKRCCIRPTVDEDGDLDWGAFGTVDFHRQRPTLDRAWRKAERLKEELRDVSIMLSTVRDRLDTQARSVVLERLRSGCVACRHDDSGDVRAYMKWYVRARRLRRAIRELRQASTGWQQSPRSG